MHHLNSPASKNCLLRANYNPTRGTCARATYTKRKRISRQFEIMLSPMMGLSPNIRCLKMLIRFSFLFFLNAVTRFIYLIYLSQSLSNGISRGRYHDSSKLYSLHDALIYRLERELKINGSSSKNKYIFSKTTPVSLSNGGVQPIPIWLPTFLCFLTALKFQSNKL